MEDLDFRESEKTSQFERRKQDHIDLALKAENEASGGSLLERVRLRHEALPNINFKDIQIHTKALNQILPTPFLVSSMTAGHRASLHLNEILAEACARRGWLMGVGSQRRELSDPQALLEWEKVRLKAPGVRLLGNIGIAQLIQSRPDQIQRLAESLDATAMIVHLNALQEVMQPEGTTDFAGGLEAIEELVSSLDLPVVVKETGCGMSEATIKRLFEVGVAAVDVSGYGGTHWGRIEGGRSSQESDRKARVLAEASKSFSKWGLPTAEIFKDLSALKLEHIWASGGLRSGLDAAKLFAMGAELAGFAKPILEAALKGPEALDEKMETIEYELKVALFCTGCAELVTFKNKQLWSWQP